MKTRSFVVRLVFLTLVGSLAALGQATGPAGGTSATSGSTSGTATRSPQESSDVGNIANANLSIDQGRTGDYLIGNIQIDGNPLIWEPVPVTILCDGKTRAQTYADGKGHFKFQSTPLEGTTPVNGKDVKLTALYVGCTVRASLAGYRSSSLVIANRSLVDNPDIGTVHLDRDEHASGTALSSTSASAPKNAVKDYEKAREDAMDQKPDKAQNDLKKAVQIYPQFAAAWYQLGKMQRQGSPQDARDSFAKAAAADPQYLPPYEQLAELDAMQGKWQDVAKNIDHALQLDASGSPQVWYYDALAKFNLNQRKEAEASAMKELAMDPNHVAPNTEQLLAVIEASRGDYSQALDHLRHCLTYLPAGPSADLVKQQIAQLEPRVQPTAKQ